ncbi:hypothetical protein [Kistimonas asteriae]|uniref:hypothetical protein n=1 Tax=Kistimonas asteriae TaxID=517724 RepID=UPI001BA994CC|nr:hypothetical protein [Kistimonas asteriae]
MDRLGGNNGALVKNTSLESNDKNGEREQASAFVQTVEGVTTRISRDGNGVSACPQDGTAGARSNDGRQVSVIQVKCSDSELPAGHTYQPYFWISRQAEAYCQEYKEDYETTDLDYKLCKKYQASHQAWLAEQLTMTEQAASEYFKARFEYRFVDYGFTSTDKSPCRNYGVFAKSAVNVGECLGVCSGVGYCIPEGEIAIGAGATERQKEIALRALKRVPDLMSYFRTVVAGLRNKGLGKRTLMKYMYSVRLSKGEALFRYLPDNEHYTPMHFINSAKKYNDVNAKFFLVSLKTTGGLYHVPVYLAVKDISVGQEILASYMMDEDYVASAENTAEDERNEIVRRMEGELKVLDEISATLGACPVSRYADAPVHYVSEELRKSLCKQGKSQPRH